MSDTSPPQAQERPYEPAGNPYLAALIAWLVPGAGHFYLHRRRRAAIFFFVILAAVVIGCRLEGKLYLLEGSHPLNLLGGLAAMGLGLIYFLLAFVLDYEGVITGPGYEYGSAFLLTAALMNLLLIFDAWDISLGRKE